MRSGLRKTVKEIDVYGCEEDFEIAKRAGSEFVKMVSLVTRRWPVSLTRSQERGKAGSRRRWENWNRTNMIEGNAAVGFQGQLVINNVRMANLKEHKLK